ncbi:xanthine dehydrogenase/oxidase-like isoform X2 [Anticarsia gemmatalis]|uniref:xanthine dehydrogenase/oxidase-like isoform X2 n=1 Tax=Anticarsia gemmatalis TaxID=129554 RepID=UPI003F77443B
MDRIQFKVNGLSCSVGCEVSSDVTLLDYIREYLKLKGTKYMCREAGCGGCIVTVKRPPTLPYAVNSCMTPVTSCHGWEITTIEEVGNRKKGYHPLQTTLAKTNGTQCGYCSPSWVMSMYSLLQTNPKITMMEIEKSLASNTCRCTGYRPILEAFRKFAKDAPRPIELPDIEDLQICKKSGEVCNKSNCEEEEWCIVDKEGIFSDVIQFRLKDNRLWVRVNYVRDIFSILLREGDDSYMLVCGNTAKGVYPIDEYPRVLIDVSAVQELKGYTIDQNLIVNAGNTLTEFLNILQKVSSEEYFGYLQKLYDHILVVAHIPVRNVGSIAGNLMIKHQHNSFSSDIFLLLETVGAQITIQNAFSFKRTMTMQQFLRTDMRGHVIWNIMLPPLNNNYRLVTFKIMPRSANAHALINAGFLYKLRGSDNTSLLQIMPENCIGPRYRSGAINLRDTRPLSRASQVYDTKPQQWPVNQPIMKVEALIQCAGEAYYTEDIPSFPYEVYCAFALSTIAVGDLVSIDSSKALKYPGVIAVYTAKDIPGINSFTPPDSFLYSANEEVLCSGPVQYYNQPIAIVVAETRHIADRAAKLVTATYKNVKKPVLDVRETQGDSRKSKLYTEVNATEKGDDVTKNVKGMNSIYGQYHFVMETLTCVIKPSDEGLDVYCATQWLEGVQLMISRALKIDQNRIDVHNRRVGGAYGIKMSRCIQGAVASALVVTKLNRPCRFIQSLTTNMRAVGKRLPCVVNFDADINNSGVIQSINFNLYEDNGYKTNEQFTLLGTGAYNNAYKKSRWNYKSYDSITDTAKNTWARAPGTLEHIAMAELVMEQIAYETSQDPLDVRLANLDPEYEELRGMVNDVLLTSDYKKRRAFVDDFNKDNRWKKRGLRFALLRWTPLGGINVCVNVSVYRGDGTVIITHGSIEMGQGINTRAVQVAAYILKIPVDKIVVKENNTVIAPNVSLSGGSITSLNVVVGVRRACEELMRRLQPIRDQMDNPTWEQLITKAHQDNVDLQSHGFTRTDEEYPFPVYGVTLVETEVDVITGEFQVVRVDLCQDAGQSINPEIDIGQVEGSFIMGMGYWTCERLVYAPTGELLSDRSWDYHVPLAGDIPQDWRVCLRKNSYSSDAIFGAKSIGEPPICMAVAVGLSIREALVAARLESGIPTTQWFQEDGPYTVDRNFLLASTKIEDFKFK